MKAKVQVIIFLATLLGATEALRLDKRGASGVRRGVQDVVKMLQGMLDQSKADSDAERGVYAAHRCYCDKNANEKTKSIADGTKQISLLENEIEELRAGTGEMTIGLEQMHRDMLANVAARTEAQGLRDKAKQEFEAEEADLSAAIGQLDQAMQLLEDLGADQTAAASFDHTKFMSSDQLPQSSLAGLRSRVKQALLAASTLLKPKQRDLVEALLQTPFTGTYTAQSAEVFGILKNMRETFSTNLETARSTEKAQKEAFESWLETKEDEHEKLSNAYDAKQALVGLNDGSLGTKQSQLTTAKTTKLEDEEFLVKLKPICSEQSQDYEARKLMRANEEATLAKAIAVLHSNSAFTALGQVETAGRSELLGLSLLQNGRSIAADAGTIQASARLTAARLLRQVMDLEHSSRRLANVAVLLESGNPFKTVIAAIDKMASLITQETQTDIEQKHWCESERGAYETNLDNAGTEISQIGDAISNLEKDIDDPQTGLKKQISDAEADLRLNVVNQREQTKTRRTENLLYQQAVETLADNKVTLRHAIKILRDFYNQIDTDSPALVQKADPAPPPLWDSEFAGQKTQGESVIEMLETLVTSTETEETEALNNETTAQSTYEGAIEGLKTAEGALQESLTTLRFDLAQKEKELVAKHEGLDDAQRQQTSLQRYLEKIKPGCDFIVDNFDFRSASRHEEVQALENAKTLLTSTPSYQQAVVAERNATWGQKGCKDLCTAGLEHVSCKACLAEVSVPGYCVGHPATPGCD